MSAETFVGRLIDTGWFALQLFAELAVLFVLISFLVGALQEWLPAEKTRRYLSGRRGRGYLIGASIGAATPFCSCSTVPLTLGLLKSGAGFGPTMTLLFTSPLVNPIIITLFWITFGVELTILYTGMALGMAIGVSWLMDRTGFERYLKGDIVGRESATKSVPLPTLQPAADAQCCSNTASPTVTFTLDAAGIGVAQPDLALPESLGIRARRLMDDAVRQFLSFLPHVVIGVLIGAFAHGFVPDEFTMPAKGTCGQYHWPPSSGYRCTSAARR